MSSEVFLAVSYEGVAYLGCKTEIIINIEIYMLQEDFFSMEQPAKLFNNSMFYFPCFQTITTSFPFLVND